MVILAKPYGDLFVTSKVKGADKVFVMQMIFGERIGDTDFRCIGISAVSRSASMWRQERRDEQRDGHGLFIEIAELGMAT
jgi:hypothetical protein